MGACHEMLTSFVPIASQNPK